MSDLKVIATKPGIYANQQIPVGKKFTIKGMAQYSYNWMKPDGWTAPEKAKPSRSAPRGPRFGPNFPSGRLHPGVKAKREAAAAKAAEAKAPAKPAPAPEAPAKKPARK